MLYQPLMRCLSVHLKIPMHSIHWTLPFPLFTSHRSHWYFFPFMPFSMKPPQKMLAINLFLFRDFYCLPLNTNWLAQWSYQFDWLILSSPVYACIIFIVTVFLIMIIMKRPASNWETLSRDLPTWSGVSQPTYIWARVKRYNLTSPLSNYCVKYLLRDSKSTYKDI